MPPFPTRLCKVVDQAAGLDGAPFVLPPNARLIWHEFPQGFSRGRGSSNRPGEGSLWEVRVVTYGRPGPRRWRPPATRSTKERLSSGPSRLPAWPVRATEAFSGPHASPLAACAASVRHSQSMATKEQQTPVLSIVDPEGRLHEVPRVIFRAWCKEMGISRPDNLIRACDNHRTIGWHFSNQTNDQRGAWQPLHKLVFLQKVDRRLLPISGCAAPPACPAPVPS